MVVRCVAGPQSGEARAGQRRGVHTSTGGPSALTMSSSKGFCARAAKQCLARQESPELREQNTGLRRSWRGNGRDHPDLIQTAEGCSPWPHSAQGWSSSSLSQANISTKAGSGQFQPPLHTAQERRGCAQMLTQTHIHTCLHNTHMCTHPSTYKHAVTYTHIPCARRNAEHFWAIAQSKSLQWVTLCFRRGH